MKKISIFLFLGLFVFAMGTFAQPRVADKPSIGDPDAPKPAPAPESFEAKYEGGIFGYSKKEMGTLKFDDANSRLVFFGKDKKEKLSVPYKSMLVIYPQSQSVQSTTGKVVSVIPYGSIFGGFIKEKRRFLVINFDDPDVEVRGLVNFKLETKELLDSVIYTLGQKAAMKPRGDAFYREKKITITTVKEI
ncbi:MAG TPA: hypothetical protein VGO50_14190 [Pyrinomonadaceae bacterium]|jgi:hypothetical protein|nr:hypothetical protein [Pyrinomonadaceae bacterium]